LLDGAVERLNRDPPGSAELRGHVVLVDFWTLTCVNWLRQVPYVRGWFHVLAEAGQWRGGRGWPVGSPRIDLLTSSPHEEIY
jgi:hypothetical protein